MSQTRTESGSGPANLKTAHDPEGAKRRWLKLSVDEDLFHHVHIVAAQSRMRLTPYLRAYLALAEPFDPGKIPSEGAENP